MPIKGKKSAKAATVKEEREQLSIDEVADRKLRSQLTAACLEYREHAVVEAAAKAAKQKLMTTIQPLVEKLRTKRLNGDGFIVLRSAGRKQLSKEKLLENGVELETIESSMVMTKGGWQVRGVKEGASDET